MKLLTLLLLLMVGCASNDRLAHLLIEQQDRKIAAIDETMKALIDAQMETDKSVQYLLALEVAKGNIKINGGQP